MPNETNHSAELDVSEIESEVDFDIWYRNYGIDMKMSAMYDPIVLKKVDTLCDAYNSEQLKSAIHDLKWSEIFAKRECYEALSDFRSLAIDPNSGGSSVDLEKKVADTKVQLDNILVKLTTLQLAVERFENNSEHTAEEEAR